MKMPEFLLTVLYEGLEHMYKESMDKKKRTQ